MKLTRFLHIIIYTLFIAVLPATAIEKNPGDGLKLMVEANKYYQNEQFSEALTLYTQAMEAAKDVPDEKTVIACIGNIGNIYGIMEDYDRALYYFQKGYDMATEQNNIELRLKFAINAVVVYCMKGDINNARKFYKIQMSLPYKSTPMTRYHALANQSFIDKAEGNLPAAMYYQRQALQVAIDGKLGERYVGPTYMEVGNILYKMKRYDEARREYLSGYAIIKKDGDKAGEASACRDLYVLYNHEKDSVKANYYQNRYLALNDSIFDSQRMNAAKAKLFDYENRQNSEIIGRLTEHNLYLTIASIIFLLLAAAVAILYIKLRQRNRRLLESQELLVANNKELMRQSNETKELRHQYVEALKTSPDHMETSPNPSKGGEMDNTSTMEDHSTPTLNRSGNPASPPLEGSGEVSQGSGEVLDVTLSVEQTNRLLEKINNVFDDISVISRDDFSLSMLAQMVGSNTKYVSKVINDTYGKNFKTYLNEFRIREACKRLSDTEHYGNMTIQAIYQELGYKAAGGFIQAFRKVVGMTPSQYQKLSRKAAEATE